MSPVPHRPCKSSVIHETAVQLAVEAQGWAVRDDGQGVMLVLAWKRQGMWHSCTQRKQSKPAGSSLRSRRLGAAAHLVQQGSEGVKDEEVLVKPLRGVCSAAACSCPSALSQSTCRTSACRRVRSSRHLSPSPLSKPLSHRSSCTMSSKVGRCSGACAQQRFIRAT